MIESTRDGEAATIAASPFVRDQRSLQTPMGLIMTLGMVAVAVTLCGAAFYFGV
jgi:hypothetical protein